MNIKIFRSRSRSTICVLLMVAAVIGLTVGGVLADNLVGQEGEEITPIPMVKVTIKKKEIDAVITNVGDRFKISKEAIITGMNGEQVSIREFLVPCDAEITYRTEKGERIAQRIKTTRLGSDTTWKWESRQPE